MSNFQEYGSLIAPHDTWTLISLVVLGVAASIYLEQTYRWAAKLSGPVLALVAVMVNLAVTLSLGKMLGLNLEELLICVNATLGGAPSAAAMAIAKGWPKLVLPALLVGIWGYVIGTPLGIAMGRILAAML